MAGTDTQPYLNGKRVYKGASHSPSNSHKAPGGYVQRELKKKSQKRSGDAEALLRAKEMHQQRGESPEGAPKLKNPFIQRPMTPVGSTGIMKDAEGRLHYGSSPASQTRETPTVAPESNRPAF